MPTLASTRNAKIALVLAVACGLLLAHRLGVLREFADPVSVKRTLLGLGPLGYLVFLGAYTALQPFGVPGTVFVVAAPLVWPWKTAFVLSMAGTMGASVVGFSFARFIARDWVERTIPPRFRKYEAALERRAFATVFWLRLVFWMPQWLHSLLGVSNVSFWTHFWASLAGYALPLLAVSYFGEQLLAVLASLSPRTWLAVGVATAIVMALGWVHYRRSHLEIGK